MNRPLTLASNNLTAMASKTSLKILRITPNPFFPSRFPSLEDAFKKTTPYAI